MVEKFWGADGLNGWVVLAETALIIVSAAKENGQRLASPIESNHEHG
jgi:hypothetical protein